MNYPEWYYNLQVGERQSPLGYLFQCLLESRMRVGVPTEAPEEEEANVYLGHLLLAAMTSGYQEQVARYVAATDTDVFHKIEHSQESGEKFCVYRANADHRLLQQSVFRTPQTPVSDDVGSTYYHFAATYNRQIYRRTTPLSLLLEHLGEQFHAYEAILTHMRHAYFQLWQSVPETDWKAWQRSLDHGTPPNAPTGSP